MRADDWPTPTRIIGELLTSHPEAESLLAEAGHRQAFAAWSTAGTGTKFTGAQAARRGYEELWHRLEPRRGRSVPFEVGLLVLAVAGAGLAMLDFVGAEPAIRRGGTGAPRAGGCRGLGDNSVARHGHWPPAMLGPVVGRRSRRHGTRLLPVALHAFAPYPGWPAAGGLSRGGGILCVLVAAFILLLVAGAAGVIAHMEPVGLLAARLRWHRARVGYEEAVRVWQAD